MICSIHHSENSPLAHQKWAFNGEPTTLMQLEDRVYDLGLTLAALYAEEEGAREAGQLQADKLEELIRRMDALAVSLNASAPALAAFKPADPHENEFWSFESAAITAFCLTLLLDLSMSIHHLVDELKKDASLPDQRAQILAEFILSQKDNWHEELGWRIVSAAAYMIQEDMGINGPTKALFPLWMIINILPHDHAGYSRALFLFDQMIAQGRTRHPLDYPHPDEKPNRRLPNLNNAECWNHQVTGVKGCEK